MIPSAIQVSHDNIVNTTKEEVMKHFNESIALNPDLDKNIVGLQYLNKLNNDIEYIRKMAISISGFDAERAKFCSDVADALEKWYHWIEEDIGINVTFI